MKMKSGRSVLFNSKAIGERRLAIQKLWSSSERAERHRVAMDAQAQLELLISVGHMKSNRIKNFFESPASL